VISRRAVLGTGATVGVGAACLVVAEATGSLDDIARAVGVRPHPEPAASDTTLLTRVAQRQGELLALVDATGRRHRDLAPGLASALTAGKAHLEAVGGARQPHAPDIDDDPSTALATLADAYRDAADERASDAIAAVSPDLARVLASMAAGLDQLAATAAQGPA